MYYTLTAETVRGVHGWGFDNYPCSMSFRAITHTHTHMHAHTHMHTHTHTHTRVVKTEGCGGALYRCMWLLGMQLTRVLCGARMRHAHTCGCLCVCMDGCAACVSVSIRVSRLE
jgi:hypothetical protein